MTVKQCDWHSSPCCSQDRISLTVELDMLKVANVELCRSKWASTGRGLSVTWGGRLKWSTPGTKTRVNRALQGRKCRCPTVILRYDESYVRQEASSKRRTASTFTCSVLGHQSVETWKHPLTGTACITMSSRCMTMPGERAVWLTEQRTWGSSGP